ncbi:unnamed protein product [Scytosiphon promiscuus]
MTDTMLRSFVDGNEAGPTIVFVHGWPDDHTLWDKQVAHLKDRFRCVTVDLPGFSADEPPDAARKWGYTFEELAKRLERTIEATGNGKPVYLVAHDWGCFCAYMVERARPGLVKKMVPMDVGGGLSWWPSLSLMLIATYQIFLMVAFLIGGHVGDLMARWFARLVGAPSASNVAKASVCYPYFHFWKAQTLTCLGMGPYTPLCPVLYMYGTRGAKKLMSFHAGWWADEIRKKEGSSVVELRQAAHWLMLDQGADVVNVQLDKFLTED